MSVQCFLHRAIYLGAERPADIQKHLETQMFKKTPIIYYVSDRRDIQKIVDQVNSDSTLPAAGWWIDQYFSEKSKDWRRVSSAFELVAV